MRLKIYSRRAENSSNRMPDLDLDSWDLEHGTLDLD